MILPFSKKLKTGKETHFLEKIWINKNIWSEADAIDFSTNNTHILDFDDWFLENSRPKIHTIRTDEKNRWKQGNKIHPVFENRTKNQHQFAPTFICNGIQLIDIQIIDMPFNSIKISEINGSKSHFLTDTEIELLAINDGFENIIDFFNWFNTDFKGKIIHFTDFRY